MDDKKRKDTANAEHVAGDRDLQFGGSGYVRYVQGRFVTDPTVNIDQRFYVITYGESANVPSTIVGRLPDGAIDPGFGSLAIPYVDDDLRALIDIQGLIFNNNGKITCVGITDVTTESGRYFYPAAIRITTSGAMDESFGNKGRRIYNVDLSKEGISAAVDFTHVTGSEKSHIQALSHGFESVRRTVQESGDILFFCKLFNGNTRVQSYHLVKIAENGEPVDSFGINGVVTIPSGGPDRRVLWLDYGIDGDGSITLAGSRQGVGVTEGVVARYTSDGLLDSGFGVDGEQIIKLGTAGNSVKRVTVSKAGEVTMLVSVQDPPGAVKFAVAKLDRSGNPDELFNGGKALLLNEMGGASNVFVSMEVDTDGRIIVAGEDAITKKHARLTRIMPNGALDTEFGNTGSRTYDELWAFLRLAIQKGTNILAIAHDADSNFPSEQLLVRFFGDAG